MNPFGAKRWTCYALCLVCAAAACSDQPSQPDRDDDGFPQSEDCNDLDPLIHPGAQEICDGFDNDCDGEIDEESSDARVWFSDRDGDGFGDPQASRVACSAPEGMISDDSDCDDARAEVHPDADEVCDDLDNDCDGDIDESDAIDAATWFADADRDGFGDESAAVTACDPPEGYVDDSTDCDDTTAAVSPEAAEICDGADNDCDGDTDEDDAEDALIWFADRDGDGFGSSEVAATACARPGGYVTDDSDCDDDDDAIHPGADERCDGADNDCDGEIDEDSLDAVEWFIDGDGDGFGAASSSISSCDAPEGYVADASDCDDADEAISPDAIELCDGVDNDCDGDIDEDDAEDAWSWFADDDGDGYGDPEVMVLSCHRPHEFTHNGSDCDDEDPDIHPNADELWYDGLDSDCDGEPNPDPCLVRPPASSIESDVACQTSGGEPLPNLGVIASGPCQLSCSENVFFVAQVVNRGLAPTSAPLVVRLVGETSGEPGLELGSIVLAEPLAPGEVTESFDFEVDPLLIIPCHTVVVVVDAEGVETECHEEDNFEEYGVGDVCWDDPGG